MKELTETILAKVIKKRPSAGHKGTFGRVLLIGGNPEMGGAIMMSAEAAVRSGSGLVTVATAPENHAALHARLPEAMVLDWQDEQALFEAMYPASTILIGPGMGTDTFSQELLYRVLSAQIRKQTLIIDGSAITLFSKSKQLLKYPEKAIFTPHQKEWERLSAIEIFEQTVQNTKETQQKLGSTIILKSHRTEIYTLTRQYKNPIGTPAMATGGMGDTLAGIIAGFTAQFGFSDEVICSAVYLHSYIGELLAKERYVVLPTEISQQLPFIMKQFEKQI